MARHDGGEGTDTETPTRSEDHRARQHAVSAAEEEARRREPQHHAMADAAVGTISTLLRLCGVGNVGSDRNVLK
jgi:hypothetical protein